MKSEIKKIAVAIALITIPGSGIVVASYLLYKGIRGIIKGKEK